jgi:hypothetical protein
LGVKKPLQIKGLSLRVELVLFKKACDPRGIGPL